MTLKEKFINSNCEKGYINLNEHRAENNVKIAEDFAIEFAEWLNGLDINDEVLQKHISTKELLEIYKKEKGL